MQESHIKSTFPLFVRLLFGGFLAVSLTDFVQGTIMFVGLVLVPLVAIGTVGGWGELGPALRQAEDGQGLLPGALTALIGTGGVLGVISAAAWGSTMEAKSASLLEK